MKNLKLVTIVFALATAVSPALAETILEGTMDGPTVGTDSEATGQISLILNDAQDSVTFEIAYRRLDGEELVSHLHIAPPGTFGPIVLELPTGNPKQGVWDIPADLVPQLLAGNIYVIIHTEAYPAGEIGGWASVVSVATEASNWSAVRALYR